MFKISRLSTGETYKTKTGEAVMCLGNGQGLNLRTKTKVKLTLNRVSIRMLHPRWAEGAASVHGCTVEVFPNNALRITGALADVAAMARVIEKTHGFFPVITESLTADGPEPGYPRIEVHPSNVVELPLP